MSQTGEHTVFRPLQLANIRLRNRIVRSATETLMGMPETGRLTRPQLAVYEDLAQKPIGLIIYENTSVSPEGRSFPNQTAIWDDSYIPAYAQLTERVRQLGGSIIMQLGHGGTRPDIQRYNGGLLCHSAATMSAADIAQVRAAFIAAAMRAQRAGFHGVQVHGAHGYLLDQFFSAPAGQRADAYGGNAENRFRLTREVLEGIKESCGDDFPVFLKINSNNPANEAAHFEALCAAAAACEACGLEALELSGHGPVDAAAWQGPYRLHEAARLRPHTRLPLILVGNIRNMADVDAAMQAGGDLVAFSRPFICDSGFVQHTLQDGEPCPCKNCGACFRLPLKNGTRCVLHTAAQPAL